MIIPLISPLRDSYSLPSINNNSYLFENDNFKIYKFSDKRFKITKYLNFLKELSHSEIILFLILNNIAHKKYLSGNLNYNQIINFIINNLRKKREDKCLKTIYDIIKYTNNLSDQLNNEL
jgi:1-deoxy-D-xylulose 5-phosphate reductoisomerase